MAESSCIFCRIVAKEIPSAFVYEDASCVAFRDLSPQAPVHVLVIPRLHVASLDALEDATLAGALLAACRAVARQEGVADAGYRVVTNVGDDGGQSVHHVHFHVLGGRHMKWPPG